MAPNKVDVRLGAIPKRFLSCDAMMRMAVAALAYTRNVNRHDTTHW